MGRANGPGVAQWLAQHVEPATLTMHGNAQDGDTSGNGHEIDL